ncbi:hypothetical protein BJ875DRAFT_547236 [Amylocarpus encephaloides]|uniref:Uncharacterized protein n=1 Tax=Amylocarpus encephaloides TaxID=45428 RepID=A0A9P7Y8I7_9HELO|nr:hypothetical protein BJ875DRAFT_547236 [Amylocarpus encephaloides]
MSSSHQATNGLTDMDDATVELIMKMHREEAELLGISYEDITALDDRPQLYRKLADQLLANNTTRSGAVTGFPILDPQHSSLIDEAMSPRSAFPEYWRSREAQAPQPSARTYTAPATNTKFSQYSLSFLSIITRKNIEHGPSNASKILAQRTTSPIQPSSPYGPRASNMNTELEPRIPPPDSQSQPAVGLRPGHQPRQPSPRPANQAHQPRNALQQFECISCCGKEVTLSTAGPCLSSGRSALLAPELFRELYYSQRCFKIETNRDEAWHGNLCRIGIRFYGEEHWGTDKNTSG